jgi:tetratricopeptide (TPR) repeat protein
MSIPKSLIHALQTGKVVPFVGAGVSMAVKKREDTSQSLFPSWKGFVEILAKDLEDQDKANEAAYVRASINIESPKYLEAMQHAKLKLGERDWYRTIDQSFNKLEGDADKDSLKLARLIWQLSNNLIVTTNIDRVFQWTSDAPGDVQTLDIQNVEYDNLQREEIPKRPTVWNLHGGVDHKEKIIFTLDQYTAFYRERDNEAKLQTLISLLSRRTFLFIGFSLDDAYIKEQLEYIHRIYTGGADNFYIVLRESEIEKANLPVYITPVPFADFGPPLEELIEELAQIAETREPANAVAPVSNNIGNDEKERLRNHFNVPFASKGDAFVGREGMPEEIWNALNTSGKAAIGQAVAIQGFGGLGKTQLAVEFAHAYAHKYPNGVFWITADENVDNQLIKIGQDLNWISEFDKGFDHSELVRNRFRKLSDCLVIFDNVDKNHPVEDYLPERGARPYILVTSREEQDGYDRINLDILSRDDARKLLLEIAERTPQSEAENAAVENILLELDGLPLAIELVGGYLKKRNSISFSDYLGFLENEPLERLEKLFRGNTFTKHDKSIIRTLKISEGFLGEIPYLEEVLDILAWSGRASMGYSILRELIGTDDNLALKDALGVALELHFIKREEGTTERYAIHRLLARVRQFEKPIEERKEWHEKIVKALEKWFREKDEEAKTLSEAEVESDHLDIWQERTIQLMPSKGVWLTMLKANPLIERGNYREALNYAEEALTLYNVEKLNDHVLLGHIYKALSRPYFYLGKYWEGKTHIETALGIIAPIGTTDRKLFADILNDLGYVLGELGEARKALEFEKQALKMRRDLFGEKHPDVATSLNNVGTTYGQLGEHHKSLELKQRALEVRRELFGEKHPDVAQSLNNVGYSHGELGEYRIALEFQEMAIEMYRELFGEKHPDVAQSLNNVGVIHSKLGDHRKALQFKEQALDMHTELLGHKHPNTLIIARNTIDEWIKNGNPEKAGRIAAEFLPHIPAGHRLRAFFEKHGAPYRKAKKRHRKK